ncbi:peptidylprolyl isomerase [Mycolicibacterium mengxianglii]|uniref:peptidylprolyl isomerase n=1 Tax=Mycolicibacterium mengxianglii TaxID=2736649 RepID=UPI0018D14C7E|nr:peptidylprolyl isomerase [Mycolicibacterium mengxianglii]
MTVPPPYGPPPGTPWPDNPYPWTGQATYPYPEPPKPTNALAVASIICGVLLAPLGVLFGHISLAQIKRSGDQGRNLAIAGLIVSYSMVVITVVSIIAGTALYSWAATGLERINAFSQRPPVTAQPPPPNMPAFDPPAGLGTNCTYPATDKPASKPARPPRSGTVPTDPAAVTATMTTNDGSIGLELDNAEAPCTVNSFVSLAQQGYFDDTPCHRLTANNSLSVLQCGDPTGTGTGGPGYSFANEYPTNQYPPGDRNLSKTVLYPRGTLAMANAGVDTNGSQFFIVYADSRLPPTYTVFGSVDKTALATVDEIAARGVVGGNVDGRPTQPVTIESIRLD